MSEGFFRDVLDALVGFVPDGLDDFEFRVHGRGLKVWYGDAAKEHFEAQEVGRYVDRTGEQFGPALEVGFHAEHADPERNAALVDHLVAKERSWRKVLGPDAEAGWFPGDESRTWRRVSEFWTGPEIVEPDAAIEVADRLAAYIGALEPIRAGHAGRAKR